MKLKKPLTVITLLAGAVSVYSQGQVLMSDYAGGFAIQVFASQSLADSPVVVSYNGFTGNEEMGSTANTYLSNPGHTVYANDVALGPGYDVGLLAAAGANNPLSALTPVNGSTVSTWFNSVNSQFGGFWNSYGLPVKIPGTTPGASTGNGVATVAIAAWANTGVYGPATSLEQAQGYGYAWGISQTGNVDNLGGGVYVPASLPNSILSFSLTVPEPASIALLGLGASAVLAKRRFSPLR
jgi:hypothetical protein